MSITCHFGDTYVWEANYLFRTCLISKYLIPLNLPPFWFFVAPAFTLQSHTSSSDRRTHVLTALHGARAGTNWKMAERFQIARALACLVQINTQRCKIILSRAVLHWAIFIHPIFQNLSSRMVVLLHLGCTINIQLTKVSANLCY